VRDGKIFRSVRIQMSLLSSGGPGGYSNPLVFLALTGIFARVFETGDFERTRTGGGVGAVGVARSFRWMRVRYTFAKFATQRGFTVHEIAAELPNISSKARERIANRDPGYVTETAKNGTAAAERGRAAEPGLTPTLLGIVLPKPSVAQ
jgi:hypothetical protein